MPMVIGDDDIDHRTWLSSDLVIIAQTITGIGRDNPADGIQPRSLMNQKQKAARSQDSP